MRNLKIVKGNDFSIIVPLAQAVRDENGVTYSDLNLSNLTIKELKFVSSYKKKYVPTWQNGQDNTSIKIDIPGDLLPIGMYDLEIVGIMGGTKHVRAYCKNILGIVNSSQDSNLMSDTVDMDTIPLPSVGPIDMSGVNSLRKYINRIIDERLAQQ
jgi:hypothetical protein